MQSSPENQKQQVDFFKELGIDSSAESGDVKKAFRSWILKNHPDKVSDKSPEAQEAAAEKFKAINETYEIVMGIQKNFEQNNGLMIDERPEKRMQKETGAEIGKLFKEVSETHYDMRFMMLIKSEENTKILQEVAQDFQARFDNVLDKFNATSGMNLNIEKNPTFGPNTTNDEFGVIFRNMTRLTSTMSSLMNDADKLQSLSPEEKELKKQEMQAFVDKLASRGMNVQLDIPGFDKFEPSPPKQQEELAPPKVESVAPKAEVVEEKLESPELKNISVLPNAVEFTAEKGLEFNVKQGQGWTFDGKEGETITSEDSKIIEKALKSGYDQMQKDFETQYNNAHPDAKFDNQNWSKTQMQEFEQFYNKNAESYLQKSFDSTEYQVTDVPQFDMKNFQSQVDYVQGQKAGYASLPTSMEVEDVKASSTGPKPTPKGYSDIKEFADEAKATDEKAMQMVPSNKGMEAKGNAVYATMTNNKELKQTADCGMSPNLSVVSEMEQAQKQKLQSDNIMQPNGPGQGA